MGCRLEPEPVGLPNICFWVSSTDSFIVILFLLFTVFSDLVSRSGSLYLPFGGRQTPWSVGAKAYTRVETVTRTPCSSRSAFVLLVQVVVHRTPCSSRSAFVLLVQDVVHWTPCSSRSAFVLLVQVVVH